MAHPATVFANAFDGAFRTATARLGAGEVELFRAMEMALIGMGYPFAVEEYHGGSHQVLFAGNGSYARTAARCELSDLMILAFDPATRKARLTYLQAKSERRPVGAACAMKFEANLEQWFLLSLRPVISGHGAFNPPSDLLSAAILNSVGSFAFFYKDASIGYQTFYASASYLQLAGTYTQKDGRLTAAGRCQVSTRRGYEECDAACSNFDFAANLYRLKIGTPIDVTSGAPANIRKWIGAAIRTQLISAKVRDAGGQVARRLLEIVEPDGTDESSGECGAKTLVILEGKPDSDEPPINQAVPPKFQN